MSWARPRRFWSRARVVAAPSGFAVHLDAKALRTPADRPLAVPTAALAQAIAAEWDALEAEVLPERLPFTRAANSAIDRVGPAREAVVDTLAAYGGSDLICYRANRPEALQRRQAEAWDPWLRWARGTLAAPLFAVEGVMPHRQPAASLAALRAAVAANDAFALTALHDLVTLSGSLVLALAVARGDLDAEAAWQLSRVDETWQAEQWGVDDEAEAAAGRRRQEFLRARRLLDLLADTSPGAPAP